MKAPATSQSSRAISPNADRYAVKIQDGQEKEIKIKAVKKNTDLNVLAKTSLATIKDL
jgi:hypothetical protein